MTASRADRKSERRNLAILFSDLCDSTRISGSMEPEQFAALLEALRGVFDAVTERHGGLIVRIDGDGLLCTFGYPEALDDAGRRATETALDLHDAVAALDRSFAFASEPIRLHSGIHAGTVLVREGDLVRGRIEILGDATNVAARLCDAAAADQILVSEASLGGDRHFFQSDESCAVPIKGREEPVRAVLVTGRAEVANRFGARLRRGAAPLCGRENELAQLREALREAASGRLGRVMLRGQPGIGKSRLLNEFLAEASAAGFAVHQGYCESYLGARPLQPFEQIGQSIGDPAIPGGSDLGARLRGWAFRTAHQPTVLAIDDWQWADDASHTLLSEIARTRPGNLLIVLASRPENLSGEEEDYRVLDLSPLSQAESEQVIAGLLRSPDPFRIERIRDLAGGSPLFIEELCHAQSSRLPGARSSDASDAGAWLDALVHKRFYMLPEDQADLVRIAAVIGHMVPIDLFAAVTGVAMTDPVIDALGASDFLHLAEVSGTLRFKHALTRDAIYRTVGLDLRKQLHARVARQLERLAEAGNEDDHVDALAYHAAACDDAEKALTYALKAGDKALRAAALDRAQSHYELAFKMLKTLPPREGGTTLLARLVSGYGRACVIDPSRDQIPVLDQMVQMADWTGDQATVALARYWLGAIHFGLGDARQAIAGLEKALVAAHACGRSALAAQISATMGTSWFDIGGSERALGLLESAVASLDTDLTANRTPVLLYAKANLAEIHADRGDFERATAIFAEIDVLIDDGKAPVNSSLLTQRATVLLWQGDYIAARQAGFDAEQAGKQVRSRQNAMFGRALRHYAEHMASGSVAAGEALLDALDWLYASPYRHRISLFYGWGAEVCARMGRGAQCRQWARRAFARRRIGDSFGTASAARAMAFVTAAEGKSRSAGRYLAIADRADAERQSRWSAEATSRCREQLEGLPAARPSR